MSCDAHINESCRTCTWVTSHIWMSHVTHINESCHTYGCFTPRENKMPMCTHYNPHAWISCSHINTSRHVSPMHQFLSDFQVICLNQTHPERTKPQEPTPWTTKLNPNKTKPQQPTPWTTKLNWTSTTYTLNQPNPKSKSQRRHMNGSRDVSQILVGSLKS